MKRQIFRKIRGIGGLLLQDPRAFLRRIKSRNEDPLFLFQFGKVASRTVATTLEPYYHVRHSHIESVFKAQFEALGLELGKGYRGSPIPLISIVRDPIAREISSYFQNIDNPGHKYHYGTREEVIAANPADLAAFYTKQMDENLRYILRWFDIKFKAGTGVDVYGHTFNPSEGWALFEDNGFRVLLLRYEDIKSNFVSALNALLQRRRKGEARILELTSSNLSDGKWYRDVMREVKKHVCYDSKLIDMVYDSQFCRHFYSDRERSRSKANWLHAGTPDGVLNLLTD